MGIYDINYGGKTYTAKPFAANPAGGWSVFDDAGTLIPKLKIDAGGDIKWTGQGAGTLGSFSGGDLSSGTFQMNDPNKTTATYGPVGSDPFAPGNKLDTSLLGGLDITGTENNPSSDPNVTYVTDAATGKIVQVPTSQIPAASTGTGNKSTSLAGVGTGNFNLDEWLKEGDRSPEWLAAQWESLDPAQRKSGLQALFGGDPTAAQLQGLVDQFNSYGLGDISLLDLEKSLITPYSPDIPDDAKVGSGYNLFEDPKFQEILNLILGKLKTQDADADKMAGQMDERTMAQIRQGMGPALQNVLNEMGVRNMHNSSFTGDRMAEAVYNLMSPIIEDQGRLNKLWASGEKLGGINKMISAAGLGMGSTNELAPYQLVWDIINSQ